MLYYMMLQDGSINSQALPGIQKFEFYAVTIKISMTE